MVDKKYRLERFPGKGGWTYACIPEIIKNKNNPFGWVRVRGFIDSFEISRYHLMPMGNGKLFLPVKAAIRKKIRKEEGDWIHVVLYPDDTSFEIPAEFIECLKDEPAAYDFFHSLSETEQKSIVNWMFNTRKESTKTEKMAIIINRLARGLKIPEPGKK